MSQPVTAEPRTVLVADDDDAVREVIVDALRLHGFTVMEATNGLEALLQIKRRRPAAVVLDLAMPRLGGLDALKRIRAFDPATKVVVLSGHADPEVERQVSLLGAAAVLAKPFDLPELLTVLGEGLEAAPAPATSAAAADTGSAASRSSSPTRILVVDDDLEAREILEELLTTHGHRVRSVADAGAALRAIVQESPDVVLLDIEMPGLSGVDALPSIRAVDAHVQVIMVSGIQDEQRAQRALAAGAFDYVTKPVDIRYLLQAIESAVMMKQLGD